MSTHTLAPAKLMIWDIDNVLYAYDAAFWNMIDEAAASAAVAQLGDALTFEQAKSLAAESRAKYQGKPTAVFINDYGCDAARISQDFLAHVHYDFIKPNHQLTELFRRSDTMHAALTHNTAANAQTIIRRCGLSAFIPPERIVSVTDAALPLKHAGQEAFQYLLDKAGVKAADALMVEDMPANLAHPRAMGMQTVLIERHEKDDAGYAQHTFQSPEDFLAAYLEQAVTSQRSRFC